ncbi:MAG: flagellin [Phycisphaerales bacterium]|nr:flagellin [Phycisphaerales bacterium]
MSRINTNVASMIGQRVLGANRTSLDTSLERLSTGLRINRGKDDPAGLIASQNLRAEKAALNAAIGNAQRADQVVNIAEGGLNEISSLLTELQSLVTGTANTAGLSREEKEANQLQIDSILQTIDRVASSTSFQGARLLNGNLDYRTSGVAGVVNSFRVNGAKLQFNGKADVNVVVTGSAAVGGYVLSFGSANINLGGPGATDGSNSRFIIEIGGAKGSRELSFASGTSVSTIRDTINSFSDVTGVKAVLSGGSGVRVISTAYGSDQFVSLKVSNDGGISGAGGIYSLSAGNQSRAGAVASTFANATNKITATGRDVRATINGILATTRGTTARINTDFLDVELDLKFDTAQTSAARLGAVNAFTITGGGADYQLAGRVDIAGKVSIGVADVAVRAMGQTVSDFIASPGGAAAARTFYLADLGAGSTLNVVDGNLTIAQSVVDKAIRDVSAQRGRLGAFQKNNIGATMRNLSIAVENTSAAESSIRDADFAAETASLTRNQILVSSATQVLQLANTQPQSALQLLG